MAAEDFFESEVALAAAATAAVLSPRVRGILRQGVVYGVAGLTVAIVALPLSMAIAIASGVEPERGLFAAIVGGFIVSLLGGSRFQIGGPAGAFIVLVLATVTAHGLDGLLLATLLSGVILLAAGLLGVGGVLFLAEYFFGSKGTGAKAPHLDDLEV